MAFEHDERQEPAATFMPVIPRLDRLDRVLQVLEEKHSLSRRDLCGNACAADAESNVEDECKTLSSALEEVQRKGTLIERLVLLENRVLQLRLEMDEGNTSKSSTSTVEVSEMSTAKVAKRQEESPPAVPLTAQEMQLQLPPMTSPQESVVLKEGSRQHKSKGKKKKKVPRKWLGLFRLTC